PSGVSGPYPLGVDDLHTVGMNWNFFVQDDIRVRPNLTLNLGLRYELPPAFHSIDNSGWGFDPANGGSLDWVSKSFVQGIEQLASSAGTTVTPSSIAVSRTPSSRKTRRTLLRALGFRGDRLKPTVSWCGPDTASSTTPTCVITIR